MYIRLQILTPSTLSCVHKVMPAGMQWLAMFNPACGIWGVTIDVYL